MKNTITKTLGKSIVYIEWQDSCTDYGWRHHDDIGGPAKACTIGILVKRTKSFVTVSSSIGEVGKGKCLDPVSIPAKAITKYQILSI